MTSNERGKTLNVLIYGSCVSRDTFEYMRDSANLIQYVARQSLISAVSPTQGLVEKLAPLSSKFQDRMVRGDLTSNAFELIRAKADNADVLIVDLIDERGGVVHTHGGCVSKLAEFWGNGGRELVGGSEILPFGSDDHFYAWAKALDEFNEFLVAVGLKDKTLVIEAPWAHLLDSGQPLSVPNWMMEPSQANSAYERYYGAMRDLGFRMLRIPEELAVSTVSHKWGASPFHYTDDCYSHLARQIISFGNSLRKNDDTPRFENRDASWWGDFQQLSSAMEGDFPKGQIIGMTVWSNGYPVDFLVENNDADTTLVSFHAALGSTAVTPPVFTGRSISQGLKVNRVFVSDPSLYLDKELTLAWFLGHEKLNLTAKLDEVISEIQYRLGAEHLVFFGMSGGGFASLNMSERFPGSLAIPVNPQTKILSYAQVHWNRFAEICFGTKTVEESRQCINLHPRADLTRVYGPDMSNSVIYVQNATDSHLKLHMLPWFDAIGWGPNASAIVRTWDRGHVPPKANELREILSKLPEVHGDWRLLSKKLGAANPVKYSALRAASPYAS